MGDRLEGKPVQTTVMYEKRTTVLREAQPDGAMPVVKASEKKAETRIMPVDPGGPFTGPWS